MGGRRTDAVEQRSNAVSQVLLGIFSYVRWPKEPAVLQLCVVGPTEYADGLLRGMVQANGRRVHADAARWTTRTSARSAT